VAGSLARRIQRVLVRSLGESPERTETSLVTTLEMCSGTEIVSEGQPSSDLRVLRSMFSTACGLALNALDEAAISFVDCGLLASCGLCRTPNGESKAMLTGASRFDAR